MACLARLAAGASSSAPIPEVNLTHDKPLTRVLYIYRLHDETARIATTLQVLGTIFIVAAVALSRKRRSRDVGILLSAMTPVMHPNAQVATHGSRGGNAMIENRSVPPDTVLPHVMYQDVDEAIAWLSKTFGFSEHYRYGDPTSGAQVHLGNAWIMLKRAREGTASPAKLRFGTQSLTVFVDDLEAHFQRAKAAGAKLLEDLHETVYGELQYAAEDIDGHHWLFSRHARDLSPDEWGATVAQAAYRLALLRRPRLCYLEIPAVDVHESATFYEKIFGWKSGTGTVLVRASMTRPEMSAAPGSRVEAPRVTRACCRTFGSRASTPL
jgi:uncharacterized glyoxalase superfamily protein PhnB